MPTSYEDGGGKWVSWVLICTSLACQDHFDSLYRGNVGSVSIPDVYAGYLFSEPQQPILRGTGSISTPLFAGIGGD